MLFIWLNSLFVSFWCLKLSFLNSQFSPAILRWCGLCSGLPLNLACNSGLFCHLKWFYLRLFPLICIVIHAFPSLYGNIPGVYVFFSKCRYPFFVLYLLLCFNCSMILHLVSTFYIFWGRSMTSTLCSFCPWMILISVIYFFAFFVLFISVYLAVHRVLCLSVPTSPS